MVPIAFFIGPLFLLTLGVPLISPLSVFIVIFEIPLVLILVLKGRAAARLIPSLLRGHRVVKGLAVILSSVVLIGFISTIIGLNWMIHYLTYSVWSLESEEISEVSPPPRVYETIPVIHHDSHEFYVPTVFDSIELERFSRYGAPIATYRDEKSSASLLYSGVWDSDAAFIAYYDSLWLNRSNSAFFLKPFPSGSLVRLNPFVLFRWWNILFVRAMFLAQDSFSIQTYSSDGGDWVALRGRHMCSIYFGRLQHISVLNRDMTEEFCDLRNPEIAALIWANHKGRGCDFCVQNEDHSAKERISPGKSE